MSSIAFAISYMFFTGIFIVTARPIPDEFTVPMFRVSTIYTVYGNFPWIIAYLDRNTIFSMTSEALASTVAISSLVGLNSSILVYRVTSDFKSCGRVQKNSIGFFGMIPAFMSIFACCGGGALVLLFGSGILASLFPFGPFFSLLSMVILGAGAYFGIREIRENLQSPRMV
ncbi:MAG: hypothetical protein WAO91_05305 [Candidatus Nitrosotenuis sp.]